MDRTTDKQTALLRAERQLQHAFDAIVDAGDALIDAGCYDDGIAVHGLAAYTAAWRQDVERMRKGAADGDR